MGIVCFRFPILAYFFLSLWVELNGVLFNQCSFLWRMHYKISYYITNVALYSRESQNQYMIYFDSNYPNIHFKFRWIFVFKNVGF